MANPEGPVTPLVTDAMKFQCTNCNGSKFYISKTIDDPNDVAGDTVFAALDLTASGSLFLGLVCACVQCGHEQVPWWIVHDTIAATGASLVCTDLDAGTADTLAGAYAIPMCGTLYAALKYDTIASHTAAAPTTITVTTGSDNSEDGIWIFTNLLPVGWTLAS